MIGSCSGLVELELDALPVSVIRIYTFNQRLRLMTKTNELGELVSHELMMTSAACRLISKYFSIGTT